MPAGPSELLVMADDSANAAFVASDLLSQAEHGADSQVILVSTSESLIEAVEKEIEQQLQELPRKEVAEKAIENSRLILVENNQIALELINEYGPEHFIICTTNDDFFAEGIANAGSVFIGNYTPESAGDYASGTNHTLPTNGYAKQYSGVNLDSFLKSMTFQKISEEGIQNIGPSIELMAEAEGLQAHKNAVTLRLNELKTNNDNIPKREFSLISTLSEVYEQRMNNKFNIDSLVRENVRNIKPYSSARDEYQSTGTSMVFLDANENPFETDVNRYPDPQQRSLKQELAAMKGCRDL
jgi:hypothetical protein